MGSTLLLIVLAAVGCWFLWPSTLGGCTTFTIVSGHSMEPTYYTGDLVVSRCGTPEVGDVVVYQPADLGGSRVIHRVTGGDATSGWTVQGDNNPSADPWHPTDVVGVAVLHVGGIGKLTTLLLNPLLWLSLIVLAGGLLLWPRAADDDADDAADGPAVPDPAVPDPDGLALVPAGPGAHP